MYLANKYCLFHRITASDKTSPLQVHIRRHSAKLIVDCT